MVHGPARRWRAMSERKGTVRVGVYVCHCGTNIAAVVDCKAVADYAADLPNVAVSRDYKYMCSDPGQELIRQDIQEHKLNRIVVASCSPAPARAHLPHGGGAGRLESVLHADGQHPRARLLGARGQGRGHGEGQGPGARGGPARGITTSRSSGAGADQSGRPGGGRRHRGNSRRADAGQCRQEGLPGGEAALHRRPHGQVRQDLPHAGLRGLHPDAEDVRR